MAGESWTKSTSAASRPRSCIPTATPPIEHGALHKPLHLSVAYGYRDARELAAVFQGPRDRLRLRAPGQSDIGRARGQDQCNGRRRRHSHLCDRHGGDRRDHDGAAQGGDHVVSSQFVFGNTTSLLQTLEAHGQAVTYVDATDASQVEAALTPATRIVFVETIANPRVQVADLRKIGELCRARGIVYIVDNTMTSPWLFRPKDVGASLVVNALTKYIGGHGNALGGSITDTGLFDWTRFPNIADPYKSQPPRNWGIQQLRKKGLRDWGGTLAAEQAHHIAVGAETLALRMERICANALALAQWLQQQKQVRTVYYPGLATHPQHELARELFTGTAGSCRSS
jgi:O-acetylhomoserine (thiol)-lyase